jgi:hypothetical protein
MSVSTTIVRFPPAGWPSLSSTPPRPVLPSALLDRTHQNQTSEALSFTPTPHHSTPHLPPKVYTTTTYTTAFFPVSRPVFLFSSPFHVLHAAPLPTHSSRPLFTTTSPRSFVHNSASLIKSGPPIVAIIPFSQQSRLDSAYRDLPDKNSFPPTTITRRRSHGDGIQRS